MNRREFLQSAIAAPAILKFAQDKKPAPTSDTDVTKEWRALPQAQSTYRAGHVVPSKLAVQPVKCKHSGYAVRLPAAHPIPTPVADRDRVFVSGGFGSKQYFCLEAATGKQIWAIDLDDDGPSTAALEDGILVMNTESCTIFTVEASSGKMLWSWWLGDPLMSAPAIAKGRVFSTYPADGRKHHKEASHLLGCFDLKTGKILWQRWIDGDAISSPVATDDEVVAATFSGTVFRFQHDGVLLSANRARATSAPVLVKGEMLFSRRTESQGKAQEGLCEMSDRGVRQYAEREAKWLDKSVQQSADYAKFGAKMDSGNGFGTAPQTANAERALDNLGQGRVSTLQGFQGSRILRYAEMNIAVMGDEVLCTKDGEKRWSLQLKGDLAKLGGSLAAPPVAAGRSVFLVGLDGRLVEIDPSTGTRRADWEIGHPVRYSPAVDGGRVFVGTQDGLMVCVDTGDARNTGWPQWGRDARRSGSYTP